MFSISSLFNLKGMAIAVAIAFLAGSAGGWKVRDAFCDAAEAKPRSSVCASRSRPVMPPLARMLARLRFSPRRLANSKKQSVKLKAKLAMLCVLIALTLGGCVTSGSNGVSLAPVPGDVMTCFDSIVPAPKKETLTKKDIVRLIGDLKKSEMSKSQCGKRMIGYYDAQREVFEN